MLKLCKLKTSQNGLTFCKMFSVPPKIISTEVNSDPVVREGDNLTLTCDARGHPKPHIVWRREDSEDIQVDGKKGKTLTQPQKFSPILCAVLYNEQFAIHIFHRHLFKSPRRSEQWTRAIFKF